MGLDLRNKFDFAGNSVIGTATKNTTTNIDFKITETGGAYLDGGVLLVKDQVWGDNYKIEVIDIDNVLLLGANTILKTYIKKWYVSPDIYKYELHSNYAGLVPENTYIRVKYTSISTTTNVKVALNYTLHIPE